MSTLSLFTGGMSFVEVSDNTLVMDEMHHEAHRGRGKGLGIRVVSEGAIVVPDSKVAVLIIGIIHVHSISLNVSVVDLFRQCF